MSLLLSLIAMAAADAMDWKESDGGRQVKYDRRLEAYVQPQDISSVFQQVCVNSAGMQGARQSASALPQARLAPQDGRPGHYKIYETPGLVVGVLGGKRMTCYVTGLVRSQDEVGAIVAQAEERRGKQIKVRTRPTGVNYASWRADGMIFDFEDSPKETGRVVMLSLRNKRG